MKKHLFFSLVLMGCLVLSACDSAQENAADPSSEAAATPTRNLTASPLAGTWETIHGEYGGQVRTSTPGQPFMMKQFDDHHFSLTAIDSTGKVSWSSFGTYELDGNLYKETHLYHSMPRLIGGYAEWEYELRNDTLFINGPTVVRDSAGNDLSNEFKLNSMREIRVRAKAD